jgi:hypothetical protein
MRTSPTSDLPADGEQRSTADRRPGLTIRLQTRLQQARLDEDLSRGADPATSPKHALRAAQLRSPAVRTHLANRLVLTVGEARGLGNELRSAKRRQQRAEVRDHANEILALAAQLREDAPVSVRQLAMAARLVTDRKGPLYRAGGPDLREVLLATRSALDADAQTSDEIARAA